MPKFLVTMNVVEAKRTSFVIQADNEDDVYDAVGEIDNDFFENHENVKWVCSDYEPPIIDGVEPLNFLTRRRRKHETKCDEEMGEGSAFWQV